MEGRVYPQREVFVVSLPTRQRIICLRVHSPLQTGGYTLKEKFSSSRCQRDKEIFLWGYTTGGIPSNKSSRRLVDIETKKYLFDSLHTILTTHLLWFSRLLPPKNDRVVKGASLLPTSENKLPKKLMADVLNSEGRCPKEPDSM